MELDARVYVAGGSEGATADDSTMIGQALVGRLKALGFTHLVGLGDSAPNLLDRAAVAAFFARTRPDHVFLAAGQTAGIIGNQRLPADLMVNNLLLRVM